MSLYALTIDANTFKSQIVVSHEAKIDFHSLVAQGYDGMKLL